MSFEPYGYTIRKTQPSDLAAAELCMREDTKRALFWLVHHGGRESFIVLENASNGLPLGFFQTEHVTREQVRLHFQASPFASRKKILRAITKLVPLIERALCSRGVRAIFFTSHSLTMVAFMENLGYSLQPEIDGGVDGVVMAKHFVSVIDFGDFVERTEKFMAGAEGIDILKGQRLTK